MTGLRGMHWGLTKGAFENEMKSRVEEKEEVDYNILSALGALLDYYGVEESFVENLLRDINAEIIATERIVKLNLDYEEPIPDLMIENILI